MPEADHVQFSIAELEQATGLSRRLIHDYIRRDLVPPARGAGAGAHYGEEHYQRLRVISMLREVGLRIERISEVLEDLSAAEVHRLARMAEDVDADDPAFLKAWLTSGIAHALDRDAGPAAPAPGSRRRDRPGDDRLGRALVARGALTGEELRSVLVARAPGESLLVALVRTGRVSVSELREALSETHGIPAVELDDVDVPGEVLALVSPEMARRYLVLPLDVRGNRLDVAMVDPADVVALDDLKFATGLQIRPKVATESAIRAAIGRLYEGEEAAVQHEMIADLAGAGLELRRKLKLAGFDDTLWHEAMTSRSHMRRDVTDDHATSAGDQAASPRARAAPHVEPASLLGPDNTWQRFVVVPDLEISFRYTQDPLFAKKVARLLKITRDMFQTERELARQNEEDG